MKLMDETLISLPVLSFYFIALQGSYFHSRHTRVSILLSRGNSEFA
jgi:hypothetical protein